MSVAIYLPREDRIDWWCEMLGGLMPGWRVEPFAGVADPDSVTYAVVWRPPTGALARFPNLKAIVSIGAGIDHVLADEALPPGVPIIRTVGDDLTQRMREYVALHVLRHHRNMPEILASQRAGTWNQIIVPPATGRRVGVMGLGNLGTAAAKTLAGLGFRTVGWSLSGRAVPGVETFAGEAGLGAFLNGTEILVCLLPLTPATERILAAPLFERLAEGACLINAGRGPHLHEGDLLAALESGRIAQATLDVFDIEPLPGDHPFWTHPNITVTPHIASLIDAPTGSRIIAANILTFEETGTCADLADATRGY